MTPGPTSTGRKPNSAASSSSRLPTPVGNQRRTSSRLTPPIATTSRSTARVIINRETGEIRVHFYITRFLHNVDIGHRLDCVPSAMWILVTTLTISHVVFIHFYVTNFSMDMLSSQQIRLGLPPSYPYHHYDHCSCTQSSSTQALVDMGPSFSSGGVMLLHPPNARPW
jgi:hypothetical protein